MFAIDHCISKQGETELAFSILEAHAVSWPFQVADVNKFLGCLAEGIGDRCRVVYDPDDDTDEAVTHIYEKRAKRNIMLRTIGKVWVLDAIVAADTLSKKTSFSAGHARLEFEPTCKT